MGTSGLIAMVTFIPVLASILSFVNTDIGFSTAIFYYRLMLDSQITYALSGHDLNVAIIFSSLQYFNVSPSRFSKVQLCFLSKYICILSQIIRVPLIMFPLVLASLSDATVAIRRISNFLTAEEIDKPYAIDTESEFVIDVDGDFTWETSSKPVDVGYKSAKGGGGACGDGAEKPKHKTDEKKTKRKSFFRDKSVKTTACPADRC